MAAWVGLGARRRCRRSLFFFWYNLARFGSPLESGYGLALLPDVARGASASTGLFSTVHIPMNLDYLFLKVPSRIGEFPYFRPDGLGMSIFITSPGLLYALRAPWRDRAAAWWLAGAAFLVLIPTLLYYGGGWLQYGYRYALDSIPFVWALCALAAARDAERRARRRPRGVGDRRGLEAPDPDRGPRRAGRRVLGVQPRVRRGAG